MDPRLRIEIIQLLDEIKDDKDYAKRLGISDESHYRNGEEE